MNLVNIQSNFIDIISGEKTNEDPEAADDSSREFWVSERDIGNIEETTQISKFKVLDDGTCVAEEKENETGSTSFEESKQNPATDFIFKTKDQSYQICTPRKYYEFQTTKDTENGNLKINVTSFDIFEDEWAIFGTDNGMIYVYCLVNKTCTKHFKVNDMEILDCKFFPKGNGTVIETVSFDYSIRIWNLDEEINENSREARKFTGHTRTITDFQFVGAVGRNFITSSKDGTVKLWECGSGSNFRTFNRINKSAVNCTIIIDHCVDSSNKSGKTTEHQLDFETEGKFVVFGDELGCVSVYDLFNGYFIKEFKYQKTLQEETEEVVSLSSVNSSVHGLVIIVALSSGTLRMIEYSTGNIIKEFIINKGISPNCIRAVGNHSILVSSNNDTLIQINIDNYKIEKYFASYGDYNTVSDCVYHNDKLYVIDNYDKKLFQFQL